MKSISTKKNMAMTKNMIVNDDDDNNRELTSAAQYGGPATSASGVPAGKGAVHH